MKHLWFFSMVILLTLYSCIDESPSGSVYQIHGLRPIYADGLDWQNITVEDARPVGQLGKIYYKDGLIYVSEVNKGIHIIDNQSPVNPIFLKFISIPGSKDISIKGNFLYTDNVTDLVVLDISDLDNIEAINRIPNVYPAVNQNYPEFGNGYFECVDNNLGTVIGWEQALLTEPQCRI